MSTTAVIVNPAAAGGRVGKKWKELEGKLRKHLSPRGDDIVFRLSGESGGAIDEAEAAVRDGATTLLSLGGDGTHNEVVNGIMRTQPEPGAITLGILPAGTGGDFRRNLESSKDLMSAAAALGNPKRSVPIDIGQVHFNAHDGQPTSRYFVNIASFGISGLVDSYVNKSGKRLGGRLTFLLATLKALTVFKANRVQLTLDGVQIGEYTTTTVLVSNGRFAGGGMMFAPEARLNDGLFDVIIIREASLLKSIRLTPKLYSGAHVDTPICTVFRGRELEAEVLNDTTAWMDIDGEDPGTLPAHFSLLPGAIQLLNPLDSVI